MENNLPVTVDPHDAQPWRPKTLHFGVLIQFIEPDGRAYSSAVGDELLPGESLDKLVRRVERKAMARIIELGFPHEKHKSTSATSNP